jgi:hypothetical protein
MGASGRANFARVPTEIFAIILIYIYDLHWISDASVYPFIWIYIIQDTYDVNLLFGYFIILLLLWII